MPPKPFPFPINIGTDLCSVPRIFSLLTKPGKAEPLLRQILTVQERNQLTHDKVVEPIRLYFKAIDRAKELRNNGKRLAGKGDTAKLMLEIREKKTTKEHEPVAEKEQEACVKVEVSESTSSDSNPESPAFIKFATHTIGKVHQGEPQDGNYVEKATVTAISEAVAETDSTAKTVADKEETNLPVNRANLEETSETFDNVRVEGVDAVAARNREAEQQQEGEERIWSLDEAKQEIHRTRDLIQRGARFLAGR